MYSIVYITHENIPVILLVETASRDIKYFYLFPKKVDEGVNNIHILTAHEGNSIQILTAMRGMVEIIGPR